MGKIERSDTLLGQRCNLTRTPCRAWSRTAGSGIGEPLYDEPLER
jgi:hypothetical protein